ncbi:MAG: PxKF domain-containing protein, partial [Gaiellaceae bacterium]
LKDGGEGVKSALDLLVPGASTGEINDAWTAATVTDKFAAPADVMSVNAHYSHWLLQPASGSTLVRTGDLPAPPAPPAEPANARRIWFTMGCHGGLNIPNTYAGGEAVSAQHRDWTESLRAAVYVANNGYGYGDTLSNALSERLMTIFAGNLNTQGSIGENWVRSVHEYWLGAGAYPIYDEKALTEANMFGLPHWTVQGAAAPPTATPPTLGNDPVSGLEVATIAVNPALHANSDPARGQWWDIGGLTTDVQYRPIQPRLELDVTHPTQSARGIIIRSLVTSDTGGVNPGTSTPTIDFTDHEYERSYRNIVFPANHVNLTRSREFGDTKQGFVLTAGQFRPADPPGAQGIERLVHSIGVEIAYSSGPEGTPPRIQQVSSTFAGGQASILVQTADASKRVAALYNDGSNWQFKELTQTSPNMWTGLVTAGGPIEVFAQAQNALGYVGYSANKGFNFTSITDAGGPDILIESPPSRAVYTLNQSVTASYACSDPAGVASCTGTAPNGGAVHTSTPGARTFTVTATDLGGNQTTESHTYFVRYAFQGFFPPVDNPPVLNNGRAGRIVPVKWRLRDAAGNYIRDLSTVKSITSRLISCDSRPSDELETTEAGTVSSLEYVLAEEQFKYHWKTLGVWKNTCRRLVVELADGTKPFADFKFR